MKIAIPVDSNIDEVKVNDSFGRAPYYLIHDTETKEDLCVSCPSHGTKRRGCY